MTIKIITDSTSDLPNELAIASSIEVIPLPVRFGSEEFLDGVDISKDDFYTRLVSEGILPTTSQPSVGDFIELYKKIADTSEGIVSIHISSKLSGTFNAAIQAKRELENSEFFSTPIKVIDAEHVSMGLGLIAIKAASVASQGASIGEVEEVVKSVISKTEFFVLLDTLEYLEKGGRIGKARSLLGGLLNIKPLIRIENGEVREMGKERTRRKAIGRLLKMCETFPHIEKLAILHSTSPREAQSLSEELSNLYPNAGNPIVAQAGAVIGTYSGPGALGIALQTA